LDTKDTYVNILFFTYNDFVWSQHQRKQGIYTFVRNAG